MVNSSEITFDIWSALILFGLLQGIFLCLLLAAGRTEKKSKYYLISLIGVISLNLLNYLVINTNLYTKIPHFAYLGLPFLFLIGPLYFYYIKSILSPKLALRLPDLLHLMPFIIAVLFMLPFLALPGNIKIELLQAQKEPYGHAFDIGTKTLTVTQIVQSFIYVFLAYRLITTKSKETRDGAGAKKYLLLKKFSIGFLLFWSVDFLALLWYFQKGYIDIQVYYLTMFCCALAINFLVVMAIKSSKVFNEVLLDIPKVKYKSSNLLEADRKRHLSEIVSHMESKKPYLDPDLSLSLLAEELNKPKYLISQVLNDTLGKSFYEFIGEYRYREVRSRLSNPKYRHLTIMAIAYDSGFSNKNTFNKVFKKLAGTTPSEFLKSPSKRVP